MGFVNAWESRIVYGSAEVWRIFQLASSPYLSLSQQGLWGGKASSVDILAACSGEFLRLAVIKKQING